jgi:hypothetical protein
VEPSATGAHSNERPSNETANDALNREESISRVFRKATATKKVTIGDRDFYVHYDFSGRAEKIIGSTHTVRLSYSAENHAGAPITAAIQNLKSGETKKIKFDSGVVQYPTETEHKKNNVPPGEDEIITNLEDEEINWESVFESMFFGDIFNQMDSWWRQPTPDRCNMADCERACDSAGMGSTIFCAAVAELTVGVGGIVCLVGAWGVWSKCRDVCRTYCN